MLCISAGEHSGGRFVDLRRICFARHELLLMPLRWGFLFRSGRVELFVMNVTHLNVLLILRKTHSSLTYTEDEGEIKNNILDLLPIWNSRMDEVNEYCNFITNPQITCCTVDSEVAIREKTNWCEYGMWWWHVFLRGVICDHAKVLNSIGWMFDKRMFVNTYSNLNRLPTVHKHLARVEWIVLICLRNIHFIHSNDNFRVIFCVVCCVASNMFSRNNFQLLFYLTRMEIYSKYLIK